MFSDLYFSHRELRNCVKNEEVHRMNRVKSEKFHVKLHDRCPGYTGYIWIYWIYYDSLTI